MKRWFDNSGDNGDIIEQQQESTTLKVAQK